MTDFLVNSYGKWKPMSTGNSQSIEGDPYIMKIGGRLPDIRNLFGQSEVVKLVVEIQENGVKLPTVTVNGIENSRIVVNLENNTLGFESNGDFFITKNKKSKKVFKYGIYAYNKNGDQVGHINSCLLYTSILQRDRYWKK